MPRDLLEKVVVIQLVKKFPVFLEPDGSLAYSQESTKSEVLHNIS